jgi:hypothetical protein
MNPPSLTNISLTQRPAPTSDGAAADANQGTVAVTGNGTAEAAVGADGGAVGTLTVAGSVSVTGKVTVVGLIESVFLRKLREKFSGSGDMDKAWPPDAIREDEKAMANEFNDAFSALFLLREGRKKPDADGAEGSAKKLIKELIDETGWPDDKVKVPVPEPWNTNDRFDLFRRYEISSAMDIMMRAFTAKGAGGEVTDHPPGH